MIDSSPKKNKNSNVLHVPVSSVCISNRKGTDVSVSISSSSEDTIRGESDRGQWSGKLDFLFSVINYAVGLGNVWRFPYLCYENGGGAFLFPYLICLVLIAGPAFVQEVSVGQFLSLGGISAWKKLAPMFKGVGYASMMIVTLYNIYFIVIIAWILCYLKSSFTSQLPWSRCDGKWNTEDCINLHSNASAAVVLSNGTDLVKNTSPVVEFWERYVLGITDGIHDIGSLRWELALYLLAGWVFIYFIIWRGLHQSGKIIYVTALFPYVILTILLGRGVTLDGALQGILYLITPNWEKLAETKVWIAAGTQVFFTFGIGFGSVINLGSYNKFHHNFYRDSLLLCIINPLTSFLAAVVIFSVLGYMANIQGISVAEAVKSGPGLAFLTYPEVVLHLPLSPIWSVLFFMMLFVLGINSQFCTTEALVSSLVDEWPQYLTPRRKLFSFVICFVLFLLGLPMVAEGGMYIFQLMDFYAASGIPLLFTVFFQTIAISWVYGTDRLSKNIHTMIGFYPSWYLKIGWKVLIPLGTIGIFLFSIIDYSPLVYAQVYTYPWWGEMMGWGIALSSMIWIPGYFVYHMLTTEGSFREKLRKGMTPNLDKEGSSSSSNMQIKESCQL